MKGQEKLGSAFARGRKAVSLRPTVGQGTATTKVRLEEGATCHAEDGNWKLVADLSEKGGGDGNGPDPGVYGRTALGTCLSIAFAQWAAFRELPLTSLEVEIQADYDLRGEFGVGDLPPYYSEIRYTVTIDSPAPEDRIHAVLEEAEEHCTYLQVFAQPMNLKREVRIAAPAG